MRNAWLITLVAIAGCSRVSTVRLQPETVSVGPGMRPVAAIQANATSWYFLFIPIPGDVSLDRVVNRMLIVTAKEMGADKIVNLEIDVTPEGGIWTLRKLFLWRSAEAKGIAVRIDPPADTGRDQGPEPAGAASTPVPVTDLYRRVGNAINVLAKAKGDAVAAPLRERWADIPIMDGPSNPALRPDVLRRIETLERDVDQYAW